MTPVIFIHWGDTRYLELSIAQAEKYNPVFCLLNPTNPPISMEIERWFILNSFMKTKELKRCLYIDSDVLLFRNIDNDFLDCDLALSKSHSGHTMFVNNRQVLDTFCLYAQKNIDNLSLINRTRERLPDHIFPDAMGDMVLWNNFIYEFNYFIRDTAKVLNNSVYSHNINTDNFDSETFMNSLHFQGGAKERMPFYV